MTDRVHFPARKRALCNGHKFHVAAVLRRNGKIIRVGTNTNKTHPRFIRRYSDGTFAAHMHAEMDVLRFSEPGDELEVMRFRRADNQLAMAKPCKYCMVHIRAAGIRTVRYTDEQGRWMHLDLRENEK